MGTTQFAFLAPDGVDEPDYVRSLGALIDELRGDAQKSFIIATSIGVAPFCAGEMPPAAVLRTAHSAAHDARFSASMVSVYSLAEDDAPRRRFRLLHDVTQALKVEGQLSLALQPRIELATGPCIGAEALLRWRHPELGQIPPLNSSLSLSRQRLPS